MTTVLVLPRHALADPPSVQVTSPATGASVRGVVPVSATTEGLASQVTFDWSSDGGSTWTVIGQDTDPSDGWSASWDTGGYDGPATVRATATDDSSTGTDSVQVTVDNTAPTLSLNAIPDPFSPNHDHVKDVTKIGVRLSEEAALAVQVRNAAGSVVNVLATHLAGKKGPNQVVWKGSVRRAGRLVRASDGRFAIVVTATDPAGNEGHARTHVVVDTKPPSFTWRSISPEPLRTARLLHFRFRSLDRSGPLRLSFSVFDAVSRLREIRGIVRRPGDREVDWYPRYAGGGILIPGLYRVSMTVTDGAGNRRVSHARPFRVLRAVHSAVWRRVDGAGRRVALTFDDCNEGGAWSRILTTLKTYGVHATFFCIGGNVARFPDLARRTVREGNAVGDHTWDHAVLTGLSGSAIRSRLLPDQSVWWRVARVTPAPFFRPPYGSYNGTVLQAAGSAGYLRTVIWDVDPRDWSRPGASAIVSRVLGAIHPGSIVVMHVIGQTAEALPGILRGLRAKGLRQSSLPELFHAAGYH